MVIIIANLRYVLFKKKLLSKLDSNVLEIESNCKFSPISSPK